MEIEGEPGQVHIPTYTVHVHGIAGVEVDWGLVFECIDLFLPAPAWGQRGRVVASIVRPERK